MTAVILRAGARTFLSVRKHRNYRLFFTGQVIFPGDPRYFAGYATASNVNRSMLLVGSFFQGRTSPVGEMGGTLQITGASNYGGAGIFIARR